MFVDLPYHGGPPEPPKRRQLQLTAGQTKVIGLIIGFNLLMMFLGPIAGVTLFDAFRVALGR